MFSPFIKMYTISIHLERLVVKYYFEYLTMGPVGIEPTTLGLKGRCSTN